MKRILLLINPGARSGQNVRESVASALTQSGYSIIEADTGAPGFDGNDWMRRHRLDADAVIVGGGDGSVNTVLPALHETGLPLLVLPLGTANNLARTYGMPKAIEECLAVLAHGKIVECDLGKVNGILFASVAGIGLSTEVNRNVSSRTKRWFGVLAFVAHAIKHVIRFHPFTAWIASDSLGRVRTKSWQISVCNGRHYGSGLVIEENASLHDGKLHLLSTEVRTGWQGLRLLPSLWTGRYSHDHDITLIEAERLRIETRRSKRIDVDGDIKTRTPAEFSVVRRALRLIVPAGTTASRSEEPT